ncbi:MAG: hypothetical protein V4819_24640 [Verrucomicrobiota bacterium]
MTTNPIAAALLAAATFVYNRPARDCAGAETGSTGSGRRGTAFQGG